MLHVNDGYFIALATGELIYSAGFRAACSTATRLSLEKNTIARVYRLVVDTSTGKLEKVEEAQYINGE